MSRVERTLIGLDGCADQCADRAAVGELMNRLPDLEARRRGAELFRLLGDTTRISILLALLEGGELCVCDISVAIDVSDNVVSQALRLLRTADVVRTRRDGRRIYYRLADSHVRLLLDLSAEHLDHQLEPSPHSTAARAARRTGVTRGR